MSFVGWYLVCTFSLFYFILWESIICNNTMTSSPSISSSPKKKESFICLTVCTFLPLILFVHIYNTYTHSLTFTMRILSNSPYSLRVCVCQVFAFHISTLYYIYSRYRLVDRCREVSINTWRLPPRVITAKEKGKHPIDTLRTVA